MLSSLLLMWARAPVHLKISGENIRLLLWPSLIRRVTPRPVDLAHFPDLSIAALLFLEKMSEGADLDILPQLIAIFKNRNLTGILKSQNARTFPLHEKPCSIDILICL